MENSQRSQIAVSSESGLRWRIVQPWSLVAIEVHDPSLRGASTVTPVHARAPCRFVVNETHILRLRTRTRRGHVL